MAQSDGNGNHNSNSTNGNGSNNGQHCQRFKRFNLSEIGKGTNSVVCGKKLSGKSTLVVTLIQNRLYAPNSSTNGSLPPKVVIFASKYVASSYSKYVSEECIYDHYDPQVMKKLIEKQQETYGEQELIVAIDDVAVNKNMWEDCYIRDVVRYGSSLGITTIFSIQYAGQLDDVFKRNIDYIFMFHGPIVENQKLLYQEFGSMFSSFHDFKEKMLDKCMVEPYKSLVFDLKTPRTEPLDGIFWYKAPALQQRYVPKTKKSRWRAIMDALL